MHITHKFPIKIIVLGVVGESQPIYYSVDQIIVVNFEVSNQFSKPKSLTPWSHKQNVS